MAFQLDALQAGLFPPHDTRKRSTSLDLVLLAVDVEIGWVIHNIFDSDLPCFLLLDIKGPFQVVALVQGHVLVLAFLRVLQVKLWLQQVNLETQTDTDHLLVVTGSSYTVQLVTVLAFSPCVL